MTKDEEIAILRELHENDTYFGNTFSRNETSKMVENIKKDYPLLMGTGWFYLSPKNVQTIKKTLKARIEYLNDMIERLDENPEADESELILLKEEYTDLVFAENHLRN